MRKLYFFLLACCLALCGCVDLDWCDKLNILKTASQGTDIQIVTSCNPYRKHSACEIISETKIAVQFRRPGVNQEICIEYRTVVDFEAEPVEIMKAFDLGVGTPLFYQDYSACLVADPYECMAE